MVCASAYDPDGSVVSVQFFVGTNSLGVVPTPPVIYVTNDDGIFPIKQPYCLIWTNKSVGAFTLTAVATDNGGLTATSAPVHVTVVSDLPPKVRIETPYYGAMFRQPVNIKICAQAYDPDGTVTNVEFFAGTNDLGSVTTPILVTNWWGDEVQSLYCLTWSNAPVGSYRLKAVATDNAGMSSSSALVPIVIYPPPSPTVKITTPRNFSTIYNAPANINVCALERYFTNPIVNVSFFAGTNSIGSTTNAPYSCIVWSNAPAGAYNLTAKATDSHGTTVSSSAVSIKVVTNAPPVYMDW
ncbi:MAG: hypothetical protein C5B50_16185 [Verrucomicrobia bacterium]|nr:MAG: hypothetical protein C5B50_16185 [Verrucomicrobiota bacterium]